MIAAAAELADRERGSLLGLAWGDVLGCPVEYWSKQAISATYGRYDALPDEYPWSRIPREPYYWGHLRPLGLHSDDTQQAVALLHSCLGPGGFLVEGWGRCLIRGEREGAWRGTGHNFRAALASLERGVDALHSGAPSAGIGAAMRIAPLGAIYRSDQRRLRRVVLESTYTTHADIRAAALAFAVAVTCAMLIEETPAENVSDQLPELVAEFEQEALAAQFVGAPEPSQVHAASEFLREMLATRWRSLADLRARLFEHAASILTAGSDEFLLLPNHPFALLGGVHAVCTGLWPRGTASELLVDLVQQGGDTDTAGAIAGAILGARYGTGWIPVHRLMDREALCAYASALMTRSLPEPMLDFVRREADLTRVEYAFRHQRAIELV
jgi:ADP-ribosyl-[dinitrogen reductase] hydrolase